MGWRVVYIEESEYLSLFLDNIKVKKGEEEIMIPIADIHSLILDNYRSTVTIHLLNKCSENNVNVVLCGIDHMPQTLIHPISGYTLTPMQIKMQILWNEKLKEETHKQIVKGKIINQAQVLKKHEKSTAVIEKLYRYSEEVLDGDITNREGLAAKMYFRELFGKEFIRFHEDSINSALNYGYAILRTQISKVLIAKGLQTSIGIFHRSITNQFNLSDDLIEVFRPIVDNYVYMNISMIETFKRQHRIELIQCTTKKILFKNKIHTFFNALNIFISDIIDSLNENEVKTLEIPSFANYDV